MEHLTQLFMQSPDWDPRGMYDTSDVRPLHIGFINHALHRYYQVTDNTLVKDRLIAMAEWTRQYTLHSTYLYSGDYIHMDDPNPGDIWHSFFDDGNLTSFSPVHTITFIDTLVRGYRITGDISFLERAKFHWDRASKGVSRDPTARSADDDEVGRFMNDWFIHSGVRRYYSTNKGDLTYAHLLFYDYMHLESDDTTPPAKPTGLRVE